MLSPSKLLRLVQRGADSQLLDGVIRNGRPLPLAARARLIGEPNLRFAALGLALQRAVELSYTSGPELEALMDLLVTELERFMRDGVKGAGTNPAMASSIGGLAAACAGLLEAARFMRSGGGSGGSGGGGGGAGALDSTDRAFDVAGMVTEALSKAVLSGADGVDASLVFWQLVGHDLGTVPGVSAAVAAAEEVLGSRGLHADPACAAILALSPVYAGRAMDRAGRLASRRHAA